MAASGNLFGRATLGQVGLDLLPQPRVEEFAWPPRVTAKVCAVQRDRGGLA